jgi:hypothetical protein
VMELLGMAVQQIPHPNAAAQMCHELFPFG